jgi:hypothetical protein
MKPTKHYLHIVIITLTALGGFSTFIYAIGPDPHDKWFSRMFVFFIGICVLRITAAIESSNKNNELPVEKSSK